MRYSSQLTGFVVASILSACSQTSPPFVPGTQGAPIKAPTSSVENVELPSRMSTVIRAEDPQPSSDLAVLAGPPIEVAAVLSYADLERYAGVFTRSDLELRLKRALIKNEELWSQISLTDDEFAIYATATDAGNGLAPEFKLALNKETVTTTDAANGKAIRANLRGVRIALDPGHLGGAVSRDEARYIQDLVNEDGSLRHSLQFDEGTLTLATAKSLRQMLQALGAEVMVTRERVGEPVFVKSFDQWLTEDYPAALEVRINSKPTPEAQAAERAKWATASRSAIFRSFYNALDIRARAEMIARFKPHATVFIHYNAGHMDRMASGQNQVHTDNRIMVFVPGSFMKGELATPDDRLQFSRLLFSSDLGQSVKLSSQTLAALQRSTGVPVFEGDYVPGSCMTQLQGVFSRNFGLTRMVAGPLVYGETFFQENEAEALRLALTDFGIEGVVSSSRVIDVAKGYLGGLLDFFGVTSSANLAL